MKKGLHQFVYAMLAASAFFITACSGGTDVVESGTYEGTISNVEPEETEIYVETSDGKTLELYFTDQTQLVRGDSTAPFSDLVVDQRVRVTVEKEGKRLDPVKVEILE
ncbi:MAG TPA: hypothetical protein VIR29_10830 [Anseongella sp.]